MKKLFLGLVIGLIGVSVVSAAETAAPVPAATVAAKETLEAKVTKAGYQVKKVDRFLGGRRVQFMFQGELAWIVEPTGPVQPGKWIWVMKWPGAFADGTGQKDALARGYHYMYLDDWTHIMNDAGVKRAKDFYEFVTGSLGFQPKANLIGMSWGGFYSTRFASSYPECVGKVYLDNPVLNFGAFNPLGWKSVKEAWKYTKKGENWKDKPSMPVNRAKPIAQAKIPVLFMYGDKDTVVPPADNALLFIPRFKEAGGQIEVIVRPGCNHHPHGFVDRKDWHRVVDFFESK